MKKAILFLIIFTLLSCHSEKSENQSNQIIEQTLPNILSSIFLSIFPPPQDEYTDNLYKNGTITIIVNDSTYKITERDKLGFINDFENEIAPKVDWFKNEDSEKLNLNLQGEKIDFKLSSKVKFHEFTKQQKSFCGEIKISNIILDPTEKYGMFSLEYSSCGEIKSSTGFRILAKKKGLKWKVSKIIHSWQS